MAAQVQPIKPMTEEEKKKVTSPAQEWDNEFALKIATTDYEESERYLAKFHQQRFRSADEMYTAWVTPKVWEGTKMPRASLGVFLGLQQVHSILPVELGAIFSETPFFDGEPVGNTQYQTVRDAIRIMSKQLREAKVRQVFNECLTEAKIYGNGPFELGYDLGTMFRPEAVRKDIPVLGPVEHPLYGRITGVTGKNTVYSEKLIERKVNRPYLENVSIKDFFIDPNAASPVVQHPSCRYAGTRKLVPIDTILALENSPGFKIPPKAVLLELAEQKQASEGDNSKRALEAYLGGSWEPSMDTTADPGGKRVEIIRYATRDRMVWVAGRKLAIFNRPNPYGFINFFSFWHVAVPGRFYAMGVMDLTENEQRLQEEIINGKLDWLALSLNPSTIKRTGVRIPQSQLRRRPGGNMETPDPEKDILREQMPDPPQQADMEIAASEIRAQKVTGVSDVAALGVVGQGNSANRTATGINAQGSATGRRLQYLVENDEDAVIEPMLEAWARLNQKFMDVEQAQLDFPGVDIMAVKNASTRFILRASAKMQSRQWILQTFPQLAQTVLNPAFLDQIARGYGMKPDLLKIGEIIWDATGMREKGGNLFIPLSPEEKQAMNQPSAEENLKMQMQRERIEGQADIAEEGHSAKLMQIAVEKISDGLAQEGDTEDAAD